MIGWTKSKYFIFFFVNFVFFVVKKYNHEIHEGHGAAILESR